ncbi:MAG TPA: efflux RND transporter periplasmic adaptor subunit, partial [Verrucomicrobiae bacterium]|nr:efflux RND transporter periplasmic adaptor subunit [Verrucomicrobiae bacterium]
PHKGVVNFTDARVNVSTGTSEARAELPNPDVILRAGQFVRVKLSGAVRPAAYKIPQRAVLEGPQGKFVYVVDGEGKAALRPVDVGEWTGEYWVVTKGLAAGDAVIVDGVLKLGPGVPVVAGDPAAAPPAQP